MNKKDFNQIQTGRVYGDIATATSKKGQQGAASPQEAQERKNRGQTQGRKGCHTDRINFAVTPDNLDYIKIMAGINGQTMSKFINAIITAHREANTETYNQAKTVTDQFRAQKLILKQEK